MTPERLARLFHDTYERLSGEGRPWDELGDDNKATLVATMREIMLHFDISIEWGIRNGSETFSCGPDRGQAAVLASLSLRGKLVRRVGDDGKWEPVT